MSSMTPPLIAVCLTCFLPGMEAPASAVKPSVRLESGGVSVETGQTLTLLCFFEGKISSRLYWYKHSLGQRPRLISSFYMYDSKGSLYDEFKEDPRFRLATNLSSNHLTISDARMSDSATYYCASSFMFIFEFREGITVVVKGSGLSFLIWIHQSASESVLPGGSVTLNCTVHTAGTCGGEHTVYWFKASGDPHGGVIYTHGAGNDSCGRDPQTRPHTCVYDLPISSLNLSDAGTYYCAIAFCGQLLFGNGTQLDLEDEVDPAQFWTAASVFTFILTVLLALYVCMRKTSRNCSSGAFPLSQSETREGRSALSAGNAETDGYQNAENLYYAALSVHLSKRPGGPRDPAWSECWYHGVNK